MSEMRAWVDLLERYGRNGDTMLAHITPGEASLLKKRGGAGTINPHTGLLEFWGGETSDSPGTAGGGNGDSVSGFGDHSSLGGEESSIGGPGGDGNSYADRSDGFGSSRGGFHPGNNPEMGGGRARSTGLASVDALGDYGRNVNAASSVMAGRDVSFSDRAADAFGRGAPGGFSKSPAAGLTAGVLGTVVGGPMAGLAAYHGYNMAMRDAPLGASLGALAGGLLGGPVGSAIGGKLGGYLDDNKGMYDHNPAQAGYMGIDGAPQGQPGHDPNHAAGSSDSGADYGSRAGVGDQIAPSPLPQRTLEMAPSRITPESWDEEGFLNRNPEVKAAVSNGTWASGYDFDRAYKTHAGVPYEQAMSFTQPDKYVEDLLATRPNEVMPYKGY